MHSSSLINSQTHMQFSHITFEQELHHNMLDATQRLPLSLHFSSELQLQCSARTALICAHDAEFIFTQEPQRSLVGRALTSSSISIHNAASQAGAGSNGDGDSAGLRQSTEVGLLDVHCQRLHSPVASICTAHS